MCFEHANKYHLYKASFISEYLDKRDLLFVRCKEPDAFASYNSMMDFLFFSIQYICVVPERNSSIIAFTDEPAVHFVEDFYFLFQREMVRVRPFSSSLILTFRADPKKMALMFLLCKAAVCTHTRLIVGVIIIAVC